MRPRGRRDGRSRGPQRIGELIDWGTHFDEVDGHVALGLRRGPLARADRPRPGRRDRPRGHEGDHPAGPQPGANIRIWQNSVTIDLVTHEGKCRGVLVWDRRRGFALVWARAVVLATGGAGQLYRETTNPPIATGDGHAMAYRAGAELRDMEFMQFHPTVLYMAGSTRHLLTEALRGEGAYLRDRFGERFMPGYHPLAELRLATTSRWRSPPRWPRPSTPTCISTSRTSIADAIRRPFSGDRSALPDFRPRHHPRPDPGLSRCPLHDRRRDVDSHGRTTLPGLWAAGEVTSSGLHGANRLASNSLLEGLVYGARVAEDIVAELDRAGPQGLEVSPVVGADRSRESQAGIDLDDLSKSLRALMWRRMGITRDAAGLARGRPPGRSLGPLYPAAGIPRPVRLDHAKHADRRPLMIAAASNARNRAGSISAATFPSPTRR